MMKGIDVSVYQHDIDWNKLVGKIDFAMLRAGYGKNNIDKYFHKNAKACNDLKIPFGVYWFSYALDPEMATNEAIYCLEAIKNYAVDYPVCFDYEYDSTAYAKKNGADTGKSMMLSIAKAFLTTIENARYYAMNYTNIDYYKRGFSELADRFDTWLAQPGATAPGIKCGIWQYTFAASYDGISGKVDGNISYYDYKKIINSTGLNIPNSKEPEFIPDVSKTADYDMKCSKYWNTAIDVINGKYDTGTERTKQLERAGYDPYIVQKIVNYILK